MQISDPQILKPARPLSPVEREESIPKRQRPAKINTVLTTAGAHSGNEIATLTDVQNALHIAKVNELGVVGVVDRPQSQQVLSTRWVSNRRLDGSYKVRLAGHEDLNTCSLQMHFSLQERQSSRLCADFSR